MTKLKKYDLTGQEIGEILVEAEFVDEVVNGQLVKDYIVALRENKRQWSACTMGRSEISHSNQKPRPQKGTGNARQGSLSAPQFKGGGVVFGPKPKFKQHVRINRKERKKVIKYLFIDLLKQGRVHVLQDEALEAPKTKVMVNFLRSIETNKRVLFLGESKTVLVEGFKGKSISVDVQSDQHENLKKSINNLQKVEFCLARNVNGYELMVARDVIITEPALEELLTWLKTEEKVGA